MHFHSNEFSSHHHNLGYTTPYSQYTAPVRYSLNKSSSYNQRYYISKAAVDFESMNQLLWLEHVNWTRMTITSIVFNLPDLPSVQERLLQNATDLGNSIRPFYGNQIADKYAELIKKHLVLAAELVTAAVKGDAKSRRKRKRLVSQR